MPATVRFGESTPALVEGNYFYNSVKIRLDDNEPPSVNRGWDVWVANVQFPREQTFRIDATSLAVVVPAGLPVGTHALSVTDPRGQSRTLSHAITVVANGIAEAGGAAGAMNGGAGHGGGGSDRMVGGAGPVDTTGYSAAGRMGSAGSPGIAGGLASDLAGASGMAANHAGSSFGQAGAPGTTCDDGIQNGDESAVDCGGPDCPACDCIQADFSAPSRITFSDVADIAPNAPLWSPTLSADGLTMFFAASQGATERIYQATRSSTNSLDFGNTQQVFPGATDNRGTPAISYDGLTLYFESEGLRGAGARDIWMVTRQTPSGVFGTPQAVAAINTTAKDHLPWASPDELTLYYVSESAGSGDIWMTQRSSPRDPFGAGSPVTPLNLANSSDVRVTLTSDGSVAYFSSDRDRTSDYDIWTSVRPAGGTFSTPSRVPSLSSTAKDMDLTLSRDDTEIFFVSERNGAAFIYRALRICR